MRTPSEDLRRAIHDLRELFQLSITDIEQKAGGAGALGVDAQAALRYWLARAYETGRDSNVSAAVSVEQKPDNVSLYLTLKDELYSTKNNELRKHLLTKLDTIWQCLSPHERLRLRRPAR